MKERPPLDEVRERALLTAREAIAMLNALERLKQPSHRILYKLESKTALQLERETPLGRAIGNF